MADVLVTPVESDNEFQAVGEILSHVFRFPPERSATYFEQVGHANVRVARRGAEIIAGLCILPMGQWFGGRPVTMAGIAAVGVAPHHRAGGVATTMMRHVVRELHESGFALSTLYPATQPVYRRVGYEQAGGRWKITLPTQAIDIRDREATLRAVHERDRDLLRALWSRFAVINNGGLDRNDFMWLRAAKAKEGEAIGYVIERAGEPEGYFYVIQVDSETRAYDLFVTDFVALTPAALRRTLSFIADHRSMADSVSWFGPPHDPALLTLGEQRFQIKLGDYWMTRIVNVERALESRGYAPGVEATLDFEIFGDDVLSDENNGRYSMTVRDGRTSVERAKPGSGANHLRIHINALAPLYTGHLAAETLQRSGLIECDDASTLARATTTFAGPAPWMWDRF